jgi:hypothetical protein
VIRVTTSIAIDGGAKQESNRFCENRHDFH